MRVASTTVDEHHAAVGAASATADEPYPRSPRPSNVHPRSFLRPKSKPRAPNGGSIGDSSSGGSRPNSVGRG
eukprot:1435496-Lingulodinium_polyedra.AAC.1